MTTTLWLAEAVGRKGLHAIAWAGTEEEARRVMLLDDPMWAGALVRPVLSLDGWVREPGRMAGVGKVGTA